MPPQVPTGFQRGGDLEPYRVVLRRGKERGLEMVAANPDLHVVLPDGVLGHMPGNMVSLQAPLKMMRGGCCWCT